MWPWLKLYSAEINQNMHKKYAKKNGKKSLHHCIIYSPFFTSSLRFTHFFFWNFTRVPPVFQCNRSYHNTRHQVIDKPLDQDTGRKLPIQHGNLRVQRFSDSAPMCSGKHSCDGHDQLGTPTDLPRMFLPKKCVGKVRHSPNLGVSRKLQGFKR